MGAHSSDDCAAASLLQRLCSSSKPHLRRFCVPAAAGGHRVFGRFSGATC
ncbi:hypothetical protein BURMUCGD2M_3969 [Burkholderia multivorans CGD2M]|nr:hypothetical protein BURMUCGD1_3633 [Burkholderia multivorans CGD1]EEE06384.1 hypothetical protein BURMUCGD2_3980 [Burkholderia multivorans CGD2]EEE12005.1 hypothetical protein BURMUCGD2M_3969 [Burkholderia multivorans CGD2M]